MKKLILFLLIVMVLISGCQKVILEPKMESTTCTFVNKTCQEMCPNQCADNNKCIYDFPSSEPKVFHDCSSKIIERCNNNLSMIWKSGEDCKIG